MLVEWRAVAKVKATFSKALCLEMITFKDKIKVEMCEMYSSGFG
jgi:hypothetical protein